jgi:hypothetical protein
MLIILIFVVCNTNKNSEFLIIRNSLKTVNFHNHGNFGNRKLSFQVAEFTASESDFSSFTTSRADVFSIPITLEDCCATTTKCCTFCSLLRVAKGVQFSNGTTTNLPILSWTLGDVANSHYYYQKNCSALQCHCQLLACVLIVNFSKQQG